MPNSDQAESIGPSKIIQVSVCDTFLMITGDEGLFDKLVWRWSLGGVDIVITDTRELVFMLWFR